MMKSPLKKPDNDDTPRDPSMLRSHFPREDESEASQEAIDEDVGDEMARAVEEDPDVQLEEQRLQQAPSPPEAPKDNNNNNNDENNINDNNNSNNNKPKAPKKPKRELNPRWKEVQETGKWGEVSKKDLIIATTVGLVVIVGVIVGVVLGTRSNDDAPVDSLARQTKPPTMAPTMMPPETELVVALDAIDFSDYTYLYLQEMPLTVAEYEGLMDDPTATPQTRAMSWLLFNDDRNIREEAGERWALASLYYSWEGNDWTSADKWLSSENACEWEHITCDLVTGDIQDINLESNNLVGTIPPEIALLNTTQSLWLRSNLLSGPLPNEVFGSMPRLSILYLDNNRLTGTISIAIRDNEVLNSLFLQSNDLTGEWPRLFCPFSSDQPAAITNFGIDCEEVVCLQAGCCNEYNCYYDA